MSILLDALKKSEEQRQLGQAPSIHSPSGETSDRRSGGTQWIPLAMMSLAAVAMAWIGWQQLQPPAAGAEAGAAVVAENGEAGPGEAVAASDAAAGEARETAAERPVARRPQLLSAPARRTPVESLAVTSPAPDEASQAEGSRAGLSQSVRDFAATEEDTPTVSQASPEDGAPQETGNSAAQPTAERSAANAETDPRATEPISFWALPQSIRDALPELRITVLVYADKPENRFVLIEGQRVVEKDRLSDGVVLEEIRRDGAVFEYRNYRFLVEG